MIQFLLAAAVSQAAPEPVVVACKFDRLPLMLLTFRNEADSTLQIGDGKPSRLHVGSSLMTAARGSQEFTFSLRLPASVTVSAPGNDPQTYGGECASTLQPGEE